ncbi:MAG: hypothetical protein IKE66_11980 [Hyphomicrobium sp.]|nr:hypothetical protein [Hyphomicrobium sp.]
MHRLTTSFILGYHGCSEDVAEQLLAGKPFHISQNDHDWLGSGIYFWQANPHRALSFAREVKRRRKEEWPPAVVGAVIDPGLCLDLASEVGVEAVKAAHTSLIKIYAKGGKPLPQNTGGKDLLQRFLDRAVIETLHDIRNGVDENGLPFEPIDTVLGIFIEGSPIYENSGFYQKTHIQICVRDPKRIKGVFRVRASDIA